jgi:hypothetical protein
MNKAALASLLAISSFVPGLSLTHAACAQMPGGQIQMDAAEQADYDNAMNKLTAPAAQAPALEAYLAKYPKSQVKNYVLQRIMLDYSQVDPTKAIGAADNYLAVNPTNLQAMVIEVAFRKAAAEKLTDPTAKQAGLDAAASYATKGLAAAQAPKPADMTADQYKAVKTFATPTFYSIIGEAALNKKDGAGAVAAYTSELAALPAFNSADVSGTDAAKKQAALTYLQETDLLGQAYYSLTPPDYVNCTFYTTRAATFAPDAFKASLQPLADYCYKKFHGAKEGYDAVVTAASANATPPADFKITPAPTDADQVNKIMADTKPEELPALAISDKEYILQYGTTEQAEKVFDTIKGKTVEIPDALIISATAEKLMVAVSDDAVQSKTADFTFVMKTDLKTLPENLTKIKLAGTYASYTQKPVMITMNDAEVVEAKKVAPKPAPRAAAHKPATRRR